MSQSQHLIVGQFDFFCTCVAQAESWERNGRRHIKVKTVHFSKKTTHFQQSFKRALHSPDFDFCEDADLPDVLDWLQHDSLC